GYSEITEGGVLGGLNAAADRPAAPVIGIRTDDIAAARQAVEAAGGTMTRPIVDYPGGQRFFFREPGGSEVLVYCRGNSRPPGARRGLKGGPCGPVRQANQRSVGGARDYSTEATVIGAASRSMRSRICVIVCLKGRSYWAESVLSRGS